ncbi:hypothetical protein ROA7450_03026 [Roseovarius albus]|uniref:Uncharacterized protein n=1 Tax=Roseovarius albus TaxID=1247867 RepID=A0A1X6ZQJ9_9RHOB|nr:hypothetical protein [Roseovarius albus]SLN58704.1 hypothetical protein ROA7450_03026 [Roseovarius albus]
MLAIFLPGPVIFLISLVLPKSYKSALIYAVLAAIVFIVHAFLPAVTGSDPAGNAMASGFRAIMYFSAVAGLIFAAINAAFYTKLGFDQKGWGAKLALAVPCLIGSGFILLLLLLA